MQPQEKTDCLTQQQIKIWHDNDDYCDDDELIEWYHVSQK